MNLLEAFDQPFSRWRQDPASWHPWRVFIKALTAQSLEPDELALYERCTGRETPPASPVREAWCVVGRRGRKSSTAAMIACHAAVYGDWPRAPGETLRVLVVASTLDQARIIRSYCWALLSSLPALRRLIVASDAETITLSNGIEIKCVSNSFRSIRGPTVVCAIFDEVAFWFDESTANPDKEIYRAVKPAMLTAPGSILLGISSPYGKRGLLYEKHRDHFGHDGKVLVWQADTITMNPAAPADEIEAAYRDDPVAAGADFGAQFRDDVSTFLDADLLNTLVRSEPLEVPPDLRRSYRGFVDPSGGRGDSFTCAIGHKEDGKAIVDVVRAWSPPFDPAVVTRQCAELVKGYGINVVTGDAYAGEWPVKAFSEHGVTYRTSPKPKSQIYLESLPQFTRGEVELPDDRRLLIELAGLERRTARTGKDTVDHGRGRHDDRANAVCGLLVELVGGTVASWGPDAIVLGPMLTAVRHEMEMGHGEAIDPDRPAIDWDGAEREGNRIARRMGGCAPRLGIPGRTDWAPPYRGDDPW